MDSEKCTQAFDTFLIGKVPKFPGKTIFAKVWGSHSHDCARATSDVDFLAVYMSPPADFLGLLAPVATVDATGPDFQAHELGKFCQLLLKGNPGIVECLFTEQFCVQMWPFTELVAERRRFLTARCVEAYAAYARSQLHRLEAGRSVHASGGDPTEKWAFHMARLMQDATRIAQGKDPEVVKTGVARQFLLNLREGIYPLSEAVQYTHAALEHLEHLRPSWEVAPPVDVDWLNTWLVGVRWKYAEILDVRADLVAPSVEETEYIDW